MVAAAKAAGEKEDEDATEILEAGGAESEPGAEEEPEVEAVAEAEQLAEDVADAPAEDIAEAEAFAEAGEERNRADRGDRRCGALEGEEAIEAEEAAPEVHEAAVESAEEAAEVADEVAEETRNLVGRQGGAEDAGEAARKTSAQLRLTPARPWSGEVEQPTRGQHRTEEPSGCRWCGRG